MICRPLHAISTITPCSFLHMGSSRHRAPWTFARRPSASGWPVSILFIVSTDRNTGGMSTDGGDSRKTYFVRKALTEEDNDRAQYVADVAPSVFMMGGMSQDTLGQEYDLCAL